MNKMFLGNVTSVSGRHYGAFIVLNDTNYDLNHSRLLDIFKSVSGGGTFEYFQTEKDKKGEGKNESCSIN